jgi:D-serine deaminase-like pyridoxal phosphate-dependent protein
LLTAVKVIYGVPVSPSQVERTANIARILGRRGGIIRLVVQHASQIPLLQQISRLAGYPVYVYIHVDVDDEPCGVHPGSQAFQDLFSQVERIVLQEGPISFVGPGFYCHQEHGEFVLDPKELLRPLNKQLSGLLGGSPVQNLRFSINATAAILHISELLTGEPEDDKREATEALRATLTAISQADSFVEVHDGDYTLMDLNALARKEVLGLGKASSRDLQSVALTILTEVCCIYTRREEGGFVTEEDDRGEALVSLGSSTLGPEPSRLYVGYGLVSHWNLAPELWDFIDGFSSFHVSRVTPECSVLKWDGPPELVPQLQSGQRLRVYPNDAAKASQEFGWYFVINSSKVGREDEIVDIFVRWR